MNDIATSLRVRDVMKTKFDIVDGKETISEALSHMKYPDSDMLIVNKRSEDDEYGIVLMSDIAEKILSKDRSPDRVNIYEIMIKPALAVRASMNIRYCARLFERFGISKAPVFEGDEVIGVVSSSDMVMHSLHAKEQEAQNGDHAS